VRLSARDEAKAKAAAKKLAKAGKVEPLALDPLAQNFGKAAGPESYQIPRTFQIAVGLRF